jgi:hypothetical protein
MAAKTLEFSLMLLDERDRYSCRTLGMTSKPTPKPETRDPLTKYIEPCSDYLREYLGETSEKKESPPKS